MKKILILLLLYGCQKEKPEPPQIKETTLEISCSLITETFTAVTTGNNIGANGQTVGKTFRFESSNFVAMIFTEAGNVTQFTGAINGHTFVVVDGVMHVCTQGQFEITYTLKP